MKRLNEHLNTRRNDKRGQIYFRSTVRCSKITNKSVPFVSRANILDIKLVNSLTISSTTTLFAAHFLVKCRKFPFYTKNRSAKRARE